MKITNLENLSYFLEKLKIKFALKDHKHTAEEVGADASGSSAAALSLSKKYTDEQISTLSSSAVLTTEQSLTDEQKAQARANISKYDWKTFNAGTDITYAVDKSTIDYDIAQSINNVSGIDGYNALEAIMGWCSGVGFYVGNAPDIDSVQGVFSNFEALVNGGATLSSTIVLFAPEEEQAVCRVYIGRVSKNGATHAIETSHRDYRTLLYYNIDSNTIVEWTSRYIGVSSNLETSGMAADAKVVGDALKNKADIEYVDAHIPTEEEVINLLVETGFISPATTSNGDIYTNIKGDIYSM